MRFRVQDGSMEPTLKSGDYVIVNRLSYVFRKPSLGDVVVVRNPEDKEKFLIKRIQEIKNSEYFVIGDNKELSRDSRHFGAIKKDLLIGKVWVHSRQ